MLKILKAVPKATWQGIIAAGTTAAAGCADERVAAGMFAIAFLETMRQELRRLSKAKRQKLARGILKARVDDLRTELEELGVETQQQEWRLRGCLKVLAEQIDHLKGALPQEAHFRDAVLQKLDEMPRLIGEHIDLPGHLDRFGERLERKLPKLFDEALRKQQKKAGRDFEADYLDYIQRTYGRLRMLGVREMHDVTQDLDIAYVSLRVKRAGDDPTPEAAQDVLLRQDRLTIRGPAGSGKTTLMHWIMVQCTRQDAKNPWVGGVPFLIPLRKLRKEESWTPQLDSFVRYGEGTAPLGRTPPDGWIADVLGKQQRGIVLFDGVDELPAKRRAAFWEWLRDFVRVYPGNRVVVTARPFEGADRSGKKLWEPPRRFHAAELDDMSDRDVEEFITKWHEAVLATEDEDERRAELAKARDELPARLRDRDNRRVRELCRTPLLCSLVCALHWHEEGYLPTRRVDLYERCCALLVDERDRKRDLPRPDPPYCYLDRDDKEMLLQRLALDMMRNRAGTHRGEYAIEVTRRRAIQWLAEHLKAVRDPLARGCDVATVLDEILIERTGLLRKPSQGFVDFPHRSFQEYLAACAAGAASAAGELADHATQDQWWETIVLGAGTEAGGIPFGNDLIEELLTRGTSRQGRRQRRVACLALAIACLETAKQVKPELEQRVLSHISQLVPPKGVRDARALAAAGSRVVPLLEYTKMKKHPARTVAACARTLALVGCDAALRELRDGYGSRRARSVLVEVCRGTGIEPLDLPGVLDLVRRNQAVPRSLMPYVRDLSGLAQIPGLRALRLGDYRTDYTQVTDLGPLAGLRHLERLELIRYVGVTDLAPLARLTQLGFLNLLCCTGVTDAGLAHLAGLASLWGLALSGTQVTDAGLAHLAGLATLRYLDLGGTQVTKAGVAELRKALPECTISF